MSTCRKRLTRSATSIVAAGGWGAAVSKGLLVGTVDQTCAKRVPAAGSGHLCPNGGVDRR
jgi:hypothetical protein